ncbi:MAG: EamA family transporter, partial [Proteobacteria bacterium]
STLGQLAVLGGASCYAVNTVFVRRVVTMTGPVMAAGSQIAGMIIVVPLALVLDAPWRLDPDASSLASIVVLGLFSTALATLFYFRLVQNLGAGKMAQVNYVIPVLGAVWGMLFLGERFASSTFVALAMVLSGVVIVTRRRTIPAAKTGSVS